MGKALLIILVTISQGTCFGQLSEETEETITSAIEESCTCAESLHSYIEKRKAKGKKINLNLNNELFRCAQDALSNHSGRLYDSEDLMSLEEEATNRRQEVDKSFNTRLKNECTYYN